MNATTQHEHTELVKIPVDVKVEVSGDLIVPDNAHGVVLFAHGSGSSRFSPRNRFVAKQLRQSRLATLLIDLLSEQEEAIDAQTAHLRFDIPMLANRLIAAIDWLVVNPSTLNLPVGLFGASTGAGAALVATSKRSNAVGAVVSRGGRPDLAGEALARVHAPTLLIVGGEDDLVIELNEKALQRLAAREKVLRIIPRASHLFEEPGTLEQAAELARGWFDRNLVIGQAGYMLSDGDAADARRPYRSDG